MNETASPDPGVAAPVETDRRLIRPTEGRVVAGVAAGLARYFGISPVVYRVAFAALVLLGGSGLILYAAAWLVIPDERRDASVIEEAIRERRRRPVLALGVVLVGLGLIFGIAGNRFWANPGHGWLPVLAIGLAIVWWQLQEKERPAAEPAPALTADEDTAPRAGAAKLAAPGRSRRRFPVFLPVLGVVIAGAGVLGVLQATGTVDVNWTLALAGGVVLVGLAIAVGAFFGGVGGLAVLGVVLATALVAVASFDVPLHGPIGDRSVYPASVLGLHDDYHQSIGNLQIDLRGLSFPPGETKLKASIGVGRLGVRVPDGLRVVVRGRVTAGNVWLFGATDDGWKVDKTVVHDGDGTRTLVLDARAGFGKVEVLSG
jgi:phage shock protein PspC (stress-responsive transcriptional regulator)